MNKYIIIKLICVLLGACSQILLKISANKKYDNPIKEYLNPLVITSYWIFTLCLIIGTYSLKGISLSFYSIIESLSYILIPIFSFVFLKEKITKFQIIGITIIFIGFIIYGL